MRCIPRHDRNGADSILRVLAFHWITNRCFVHCQGSFSFDSTIRPADGMLGETSRVMQPGTASPINSPGHLAAPVHTIKRYQPGLILEPCAPRTVRHIPAHREEHVYGHCCLFSSEFRALASSEPEEGYVRLTAPMYGARLVPPIGASSVAEPDCSVALFICCAQGTFMASATSRQWTAKIQSNQ